MIFRYLALFTSIIVLYSCARQSSPTGGAKDETPAKVLAAEPKQNSINTLPEKITLTFDEYVALENLENELIVSPYSSIPPKVYLRGKKLIIKPTKQYLENTTYTYNFGNAIKDITEGNISENLSYTFSTGNSLDSLLINGVVYDAFSGNKVENAYILLYPKETTIAQIDSTIFKAEPNYIARSDKSGAFLFKNLPDKEFTVYALIDKNNNLIYDDEKESVAFVDAYISPADSIKANLKIYLFKEIKENFISNIEKSLPGLVKVKFGGKSYEQAPKVAEIENKAFETQFFNSDSLHIYYNPLIDSNLVFTIESENYLDSVAVELEESFEIDSVVSLVPNSNVLKLGKPLILETKFPVVALNTASIQVFEQDSIEISTKTYIDSIKKNNVVFEYDWKPNTRYNIVLGENAIQNYISKFSLADTLSFSAADSADYANILVYLTGKKEGTDYIVNLLDKDEKVHQSAIAISDSVLFEKIYKGNYNIKILADKNGNKVYDSGNILDKKQPEKFLNLSKEPFQLKGGLDREINFTIF